MTDIFTNPIVLSCMGFMVLAMAFTGWMVVRAGADDDDTKNADFLRWREIERDLWQIESETGTDPYPVRLAIRAQYELESG